MKISRRQILIAAAQKLAAGKEVKGKFQLR
jgi:hypothetical protein